MKDKTQKFETNDIIHSNTIRNTMKKLPTGKGAKREERRAPTLTMAISFSLKVFSSTAHTYTWKFSNPPVSSER